ncbi:hypothetical protein EDC04DRAFT_237988 [Pisolithus marmoratus]|nr:hypothetical protein EDC04DRAFT_237988 [Pisolithus marmoratus]
MEKSSEDPCSDCKKHGDVCEGEVGQACTKCRRAKRKCDRSMKLGRKRKNQEVTQTLTPPVGKRPKPMPSVPAPSTDATLAKTTLPLSPRTICRALHPQPSPNLSKSPSIAVPTPSPSNPSPRHPNPPSSRLFLPSRTLYLPSVDELGGLSATASTCLIQDAETPTRRGEASATVDISINPTIPEGTLGPQAVLSTVQQNPVIVSEKLRSVSDEFDVRLCHLEAIIDDGEEQVTELNWLAARVMMQVTMVHDAFREVRRELKRLREVCSK